jgi:hypothetical protein
MKASLYLILVNLATSFGLLKEKRRGADCENYLVEWLNKATPSSTLMERGYFIWQNELSKVCFKVSKVANTLRVSSHSSAIDK